MTKDTIADFNVLRSFLNHHADAGKSTWQESEALEHIFDALQFHTGTRITCGYCKESYIADGGWHCPHCGGC